MLLVFVRMGLLLNEEAVPLLVKADLLSRKITKLSDSRR